MPTLTAVKITNLLSCLILCGLQANHGRSFVCRKKNYRSRPSVEQYKKQAKELLHQSQLSLPQALQRLQKHLPQQKSDRNKFSLTDAQLVIAREHGFKAGLGSYVPSN